MDSSMAVSGARTVLLLLGLSTASLAVPDVASLCASGQCDRTPSTCTGFGTANPCVSLVSYSVDGDSVLFNLARTSDSSSQYVAVGFSTDNQMGNDPMVGCIYDGTSVHVKAGYNPSTSNQILSPQPSGLIDVVSTSVADSVLHCEFRHLASPADLQGGKVADLAGTAYFRLLAYGNAGSATSLSMHSLAGAARPIASSSASQLHTGGGAATTTTQARITTTEKARVETTVKIVDSGVVTTTQSTVVETQPPVTQPPVTENQAVQTTVKASGQSTAAATTPAATTTTTASATAFTLPNSFSCGSINCVRVPEGCDGYGSGSCVSTVAFEADGDYVKISLIRRMEGTGPQYIAMGFSTDDQMGSDPVTACIYDGTTVSVKAAYNPGTSNDILVEQPETLFDSITATAADGLLQCEFRQLAKPANDLDKLPNLAETEYHLLSAFSTAKSDGSLEMHGFSGDAYPRVSGVKVILASEELEAIAADEPAISLTATEKLNLKKTHGIFMLFGWWLFVATAVLIARYFRTTWEDKKLLGKMMWFSLHRILNSVGLLFIFIAFICIFIAEQHWIGKGSSDVALHAIFGLMAVLGGTIQPIMALARCGPKTPKRPIFNWAHRLLGVYSFLCATIAIYYAGSFKGFFPNNMHLHVFVVYFVFLLSSVIALEVYAYMQTKQDTSRDQSNFQKAFRPGVLLCFVLLNFCLCFALAYKIGSA